MSVQYAEAEYQIKLSEKSDLVNVLQAGDAIMVNRGFLIDEICDLNSWKLIRPPFLRDKKQFTKAEANETAKIASARVHIERPNQRLKVFRILGDTMPFPSVRRYFFSDLCYS